MAFQHIRDVLQRLPDLWAGMYDSPAEECFGERLIKSMDPATHFQTQVWVETVAGRFRLDMLLIDRHGRRIAIEVDGKAFHDPIRDDWRTVFIMGDKQADVVYRVRASDLTANLIGVLAGLGSVEPTCFRQAELYRWQEITRSTYRGDGDREGQRSWRSASSSSHTLLEMRFRCQARDCIRTTIRPRYDFALATGLKDLKDIHAAWTVAYPSRSMISSPEAGDFFSLFE